ncbi:MAG TPA: hypothetical protein DCS74_00895 [Veillonellaceae bacterium]|jgi:intracellular sulfur oxidation DsrE/DsrF family protein|nr:hypothetical protein [Veillonellaceae bacterium]
MRKWQVVFHIDEMEKWKLVLGNVENFLRDIGNDPYNAEIVVNGEAVLFLSEHYPEPVRLEQLSQKQIQISLCRNALRANHIPSSAIPPWMSLISAGITRLITLQAQGYAYIKP